MNEKQKRKLVIIYSIYYLILLIGMIICFMNKNWDGFTMSLVAIITPFLAPLLLRLIRLHSTYEIYLVNVLFAFIASIIGSVWGGYSISMFDKILHTASGILITELAYMLYVILKKKTQIQDKNEQIISLIFIFSFNMMIAVFWEFFEFLMLVLINNDGINHYTTGVYDSMTDMIVAMLGSIIPVYMISNYYKTDKQNFFIQLAEKFLKVNYSILQE